MTFDPQLLYSVLIPRPVDPKDLAEAVGEAFGVPTARVGVHPMDDWEDRDPRALATCEYGALNGELAWSLVLYTVEAAGPQPSERELALRLARLLDCAALIPTVRISPDVRLAAAPDGRLVHVVVEEPDDEDGPWYVRAAEEPLADFPGAAVGPLESVVRAWRAPTPVTASGFAPTSGESAPAQAARDLLSAWERLTVRMAEGWPPSRWYSAALYEDDLLTRTRLDTALEGLSADQRAAARSVLGVLDATYRSRTVDDGGTLLATALGQPAEALASRPWYWHRHPDPAPWDAS
ncbi:hypothetical protein GA0115240_172025 [Streptomyces sp. DvalAA-14]|uniref:hypothetical protein n=1 Tax=unclassified Streptomyces TaxID=2593676 RepID=UPI00081B850E|nr:MULTISPECIES: hypothetical protein [unclassified Streptomyces]MYS24967.1 hypothetical protein [Streptomyces sp. SID4948]SCE50976.1 hypothetical protein GA0115240_172025 [Streptomyces sp. DvalAA-14]